MYNLSLIYMIVAILENPVRIKTVKKKPVIICTVELGSRSRVYLSEVFYFLDAWRLPQNSFVWGTVLHIAGALAFLILITKCQ